MALLVIGGTTCAGKTSAAIHVACVWGARIVSADAMQVYRGMDIGTAKPPSSVLRRYPHDCIDVRNPDEEFSVADFISAVEEAQREHDHVVVVGGTPFYLNALLRPLASLPAADPTLRAELEALPDAYARLEDADPQTAARLHPNDRVRIIRALEVHALTGRPLSEIHGAGRGQPRKDLEVAWLDRPDLDTRIEHRLARMVERGYADEVAALLQAGWHRNLKPMRSLGYRHLVDHIEGQFELDEAIRRTARDTRRFARKQRTWSRSAGWTTTDRAGVLKAAENAFKST